MKLLIYHCKITLNSKYFYLGSIMINLFEAVRFYEIVDIFFMASHIINVIALILF